LSHFTKYYKLGKTWVKGQIARIVNKVTN